jgi:hypothetical protein
MEGAFRGSHSESAMKRPKTSMAAEFEERCNGLIELVTRTRRPLLITLRSKNATLCGRGLRLAVVTGRMPGVEVPNGHLPQISGV